MTNRSGIETLTSEDVRGWVHRIISEEVLRIMDDTELVSLVVKAESEQLANNVVEFLKSKGIEARSKYPSKFSSFDKTEQEGWGVYVKANEVRPAADELSARSKGLVFDPYVTTTART